MTQTQIHTLVGLPPHQTGETLAAYLRRALGKSTVDVDTLAQALQVSPDVLHDVLAGEEPAPGLLATFGALTGVIQDRAQTRDTLRLLGVLADAERGWAPRS